MYLKKNVSITDPFLTLYFRHAYIVNWQPFLLTECVPYTPVYLIKNCENDRARNSIFLKTPPRKTSVLPAEKQTPYFKSRTSWEGKRINSLKTPAASTESLGVLRSGITKKKNGLI